jgi:hypothetical protein
MSWCGKVFEREGGGWNGRIGEVEVEDVLGWGFCGLGVRLGLGLGLGLDWSDFVVIIFLFV